MSMVRGHNLWGHRLGGTEPHIGKKGKAPVWNHHWYGIWYGADLIAQESLNANTRTCKELFAGGTLFIIQCGSSGQAPCNSRKEYNLDRGTNPVIGKQTSDQLTLDSRKQQRKQLVAGMLQKQLLLNTEQETNMNSRQKAKTSESIVVSQGRFKCLLTTPQARNGLHHTAQAPESAVVIKG